LVVKSRVFWHFVVRCIMTSYTVRFRETERYDPIHDREVVLLMAITPEGSWHCEVPSNAGSALRTQRQAFREYVFGAMALGQRPKEVNLG
jgi:hypothetical protein